MNQVSQIWYLKIWVSIWVAPQVMPDQIFGWEPDENRVWGGGAGFFFLNQGLVPAQHWLEPT